MRLKKKSESVFYCCVEYPKCRGTHGAHKDGTPLGVPADKETRKARMKAHKKFDALWRFGKMSRVRAYEWMQKAMALDKEKAHIGLFSIEQCEQLIELLEERNRAKKEIKLAMKEAFLKE